MSRTASAGMALAGAQLLAKVIDFALVLILARLLIPEDFALIAIAMIFVQVTEAVLDIPVFTALMRTPVVTRNMLYTAFSVSLLRSALVVLILLALTPVAASFFNDTRLLTLIPFLSLAPAFRGLYNPKMVLLARRLNFFPEAAISVIAKLVTAIIALPLAIALESYWALATMTVLTPIWMFLFSYAYLPFGPKLSFRSWSVFANMIGWSTVSQIFSAANWQVTVFVLATFATRRTTGNFSVASTLNGIVQQVFLASAIRPLVSSFSELERQDGMHNAYLLGGKALFLLTGPIFVVLMVMAEPIILALFGAEWTEAPLFLSVIAFCSLFTVLGYPAASVALAQDRTIFLALKSAISFAVHAVSLYLGYIYFGIDGYLVGLFLGALIQALVSFWMVKRLIGLSYVAQILPITVPSIGLCLMALSLFALEGFVEYGSSLLLFLTVGFVACAGLLVFAAWVTIAWFVLGKPEGIEHFAFQKLQVMLQRG